MGGLAGVGAPEASMNDLVVLTSQPALPLYEDLRRAAAAAGQPLTVLDATTAVARAWPPAVWAAGVPVHGARAVLPRVGNWRPASTLAVLEALQAAGVASLNPARAVRVGRDHWRTMQVLAAAGVPCPETIAGSEPDRLVEAALQLGFPCVVKQRRSRQGVGVIQCGDRATLAAVLDSLWRVGDEVVVQRFCPPGGVSVRVLVLQGEVLGATRHTARPGEFRSNAAQGGAVEAFELREDLAGLALGAATAAGLGFCGVDLLPDGNRWVVGEINPTPGWTHFTRATGIDVAARLIAALRRLGAGE